MGNAALFVPLRSWLQCLIDRRFYRRKYDAAKTVAALGAAIRDEVQFSQLTTRLIETVDAAMQPTQAILWLKGGAEADGQRQK